jgi:L-malate glycosyltransferase
VIVRENVRQIEDYLQAADIGLFTSESEGFCLSILEAMSFACPSIASQVGGIPEVVENKITGLLVPFGDTEKMALAAEDLIQNPARRETLGCAAQLRARTYFSAKIIVPRYLGGALDLGEGSSQIINAGNPFGGSYGPIRFSSAS